MYMMDIYYNKKRIKMEKGKDEKYQTDNKQKSQKQTQTLSDSSSTSQSCCQIFSDQIQNCIQIFKNYFQCIQIIQPTTLKTLISQQKTQIYAQLHGSSQQNNDLKSQPPSRTMRKEQHKTQKEESQSPKQSDSQSNSSQFYPNYDRADDELQQKLQKPQNQQKRQNLIRDYEELPFEPIISDALVVKKYAEQFGQSYAQRKITFAYTFEQIAQLRRVNQFIKRKNLCTEFKRLICCRGGNQIEEVEEEKLSHRQRDSICSQSDISYESDKKVCKNTFQENRQWVNQLSLEDTNIFSEDNSYGGGEIKNIESEKMVKLSQNGKRVYNNNLVVIREYQTQGKQDNLGTDNGKLSGQFDKKKKRRTQLTISNNYQIEEEREVKEQNRRKDDIERAKQKANQQIDSESINEEKLSRCQNIQSDTMKRQTTGILRRNKRKDRKIVTEQGTLQDQQWIFDIGQYKEQKNTGVEERKKSKNVVKTISPSLIFVQKHRHDIIEQKQIEKEQKIDMDGRWQQETKKEEQNIGKEQVRQQINIFDSKNSNDEEQPYKRSDGQKSGQNSELTCQKKAKKKRKDRRKIIDLQNASDNQQTLIIEQI